MQVSVQMSPMLFVECLSDTQSSGHRMDSTVDSLVMQHKLHNLFAGLLAQSRVMKNENDMVCQGWYTRLKHLEFQMEIWNYMEISTARQKWNAILYMNISGKLYMKLHGCILSGWFWPQASEKQEAGKHFKI